MTRAIFKFDFEALKRASPRHSASLPITILCKSADDFWRIAYVISQSLGLFYSQLQSQLIDILKKLIPTIFAPSSPSGLAQPKTIDVAPGASYKTISRKIADLRTNTEPGTIVDKYDSLCSCKNQPIVIGRDEKDAWTKASHATLEFRNRLFVCPDKLVPHPRINKTRDDGKEFPCCFARSSEGDRVATAANQQHAGAGGRAEYVITRTAILDVGRRGIVPTSAARLLRSCPGLEYGDFVRAGTVSGTPNSLIYACLAALSGGSENISDPDSKIRHIREQMALLSPGIYAQEFPDEDPCGAEGREERLKSRIAESLTSSAPIDSSIHIRGLEKVLRANIFVFKPALDRTGIYELEVPNHAIVHLAPLKNYNQTIVLVKIKEMQGTRAWPHYENIVMRGKILNIADQIKGTKEQPLVDNDARFIFPKELSTILNTVLNKTQECVRIVTENKTFQRGYPFGTNIEEAAVTPGGGIFAQGSYVKKIYIDPFGKLCALLVEVLVGGGEALILTPPLIPFLAPVANEAPRFREDLRKEVIELIDGNIIVTVIYLGGNSAGHTQIPARGLNEFDARARAASLIMQFTHWARSVERAHCAINGKTLEPLAEWWARHSSLINLQNIPLPENIRDAFPPIDAATQTTRDAIDALSHFWPEFINAQHSVFVFVDKELKDKLGRFLHRVEQETSGLEETINDPSTIIPQYILGVFNKPSDFCIGASKEDLFNMRIFLNQESFNDWIAYIRGSERAEIENRVTPFEHSLVTPEGLYSRPQNSSFCAEVGDEDNKHIAFIRRGIACTPREASRSLKAWAENEELSTRWVIDKAKRIISVDRDTAYTSGLLRLDAGPNDLRADAHAQGLYTSILLLRDSN